MHTQVILQASGTATGPWIPRGFAQATFQASVTGTGTVGASVRIEASNDGIAAVDTPLGTITLSGANSHSDGFASLAAWDFVRAVISAHTAGAVTVRMTEG